MARSNQPDVFGYGSVGRAGPLAIDDFVKIVGLRDIRGVSNAFSPVAAQGPCSDSKAGSTNRAGPVFAGSECYASPGREERRVASMVFRIPPARSRAPRFGCAQVATSDARRRNRVNTLVDGC